MKSNALPFALLVWLLIHTALDYVGARARTQQIVVIARQVEQIANNQTELARQVEQIANGQSELAGASIQNSASVTLNVDSMRSMLEMINQLNGTVRQLAVVERDARSIR